MKILYFGGQKSGKSNLAIKKALKLSKNKKPYYIATYDNSYNDKNMHKRVSKHLKYRGNKFITIEETKDLSKVIEDKKCYLIDCVSMWIFNNLSQKEEKLKKQLKKICLKNVDIIFVLNDVSKGVIPFEKESRIFVDLSGIIAQELVKLCDEVYEVKYGIEVRLK